MTKSNDLYNEYFDKIKSYIQCGYTRREIGILVPLSYYMLTKAIAEIKAETGLTPAPSVKSHKEDVLSEIKNGSNNVKEIADKYGLSIRSVYNYGRVGHDHMHYNPDKLAYNILQDLQDGLSTKEIMAKYNTTRQNVSRVKRKYVDKV